MRSQNRASELVASLKFIINECMNQDPSMEGYFEFPTFNNILQKNGFSQRDAPVIEALEKSATDSGVFYFLFAFEVTKLSVGQEYSNPPQGQVTTTRFSSQPQGSPTRQSGPQGRPIDVLHALVVKAVNQTSNSVASVYQRWRGNGDKIYPEDLYNVLTQNCHVQISIDEVKEFMTFFGGPMDQSRFTRMVGHEFGPKRGYIEPAPEVIGRSGKRLVTDQDVINDFAQQISGPGWENVVLNTPDDALITKLAGIGIKVDSNGLRHATSLMGRSSFCAAVAKVLHQLQ